MSRHGYVESDEMEQWDYIRHRGRVASAMRGRRGQVFLRKLIAALDALPEKVLIRGDLERDGCYCAFGALAKAEGVDVSKYTMDEDGDGFDVADPNASVVTSGEEVEIKELLTSDGLAVMFNVAEVLAKETMWMNDEVGNSPADCWRRVHQWAEVNLIEGGPVTHAAR